MLEIRQNAVRTTVEIAVTFQSSLSRVILALTKDNQNRNPAWGQTWSTFSFPVSDPALNLSLTLAEPFWYKYRRNIIFKVLILYLAIIQTFFSSPSTEILKYYTQIVTITCFSWISALRFSFRIFVLETVLESQSQGLNPGLLS